MANVWSAVLLVRWAALRLLTHGALCRPSQGSVLEAIATSVQDVHELLRMGADTSVSGSQNTFGDNQLKVRLLGLATGDPHHAVKRTLNTITQASAALCSPNSTPTFQTTRNNISFV